MNARAIALAAGLALPIPALAQADAPLSWNNAAGGAAATNTNWAPSQVPVAADDLTFNLLAIYNVTFSNLVPTANTHTYKRGSVTLICSSPHTVAAGITVGDVNGDIATMTLTTGTLSSGGPVIVGDAAGSDGTLNVNDDDADLLMTGATADMFIASNAPGTLNITGGGLVQVADQFIAGNNAAGTSAVTISGVTGALPSVRSTLRVLGTGISSKFGQGGDATVSISNGALADFAGDLTIANGSASTTTVTVAGLGGILNNNATLQVDGDLFLAQNSTAGSAAGSATLNVNADGRVNVGGVLLVANDGDGGTGTLHVSGNGAVTCQFLTLGVGSTLLFNDGTITVDDGVLTRAFPPLVISDATGSPELILQNTATGALPPNTITSRCLTIGGPGASADGTLSILSGSQMTIPGPATAIAVIAEDADDHGQIAVDGAGSSLSGGAGSTLVVGQNGTGRLDITGGGAVSFDSVSMAPNAGSFSTLVVQDPGSSLQVTTDLAIGGGASGNGGTAQLFVRDGGQVTSTDNIVLIRAQSLLSIDAAQFTTSAAINVFGGAVGLANAATVNAIGINLNNGDLGGDGNIHARIDMAVGSQLQVGGSLQPAPIQNLTVGNPASSVGFASSADSSIIVRDECSLTIQDSNLADVGIVTLVNGTINAANGLNLVAGGNVSGDGLINADVQFVSGGSIAPSGAGLRFGGILTHTGAGTMAGTTFGFNNGGGYSGDGTINGVVDFDAGSTCTNTGILTMGAPGNAFGVTIDGTLNCGGGTVTLLDANGIGLGTLTTLAGASLVCSQNLTVNSGRTIEGFGFVNTPLLTVNGSIKPGDLPPTAPDRGTLRVSGGALTLLANATYSCDIDPGIEFATSDVIQSTGPAAINGHLIVAFIDGYIPQAPHTFDIVIGSSRTGTFTTTTFPPVGPFGPMHVEYLPDRARLVMCYANCDGSIVPPALNVQDFACFLNRFAAGDAYANCDGSTIPPALNVQDFACFLNKFAAGCQ